MEDNFLAFQQTDLFSIMKNFIKYTLLLACFSTPVFADEIIFSDETLSNKVILPAWFKLCFLDLRDDLDEALSSNKKGIIIYFGRKDCPYCQALIENSWGRDDIIRFTLNNFDVIAIDTKGVKNVTDFDGFVYDEKQYSLLKKTNFTPSLLFYDKTEKQVLKLSGYQQPYRFLAALEYVADQHYLSRSFGSYLSQDNKLLVLNGNDELNFQAFFDLPPHNLNRQKILSTRPLAVFFENENCHACDILHSIPLENPVVKRQLDDIDAIQLNISESQKIITPAGEKTTVKKWAEKININYSPTIVFFDESGKEIIRIDSVVWVNRLSRVLDYITSRSYKKYQSFQQWQQAKPSVMNQP